MLRSLEVVIQLIVFKLIMALQSKYAKLIMLNAEALDVGEKGNGLLLV